MEIKGKIIAVLPLVTGQGKNGEWRKQEFIVEIPDAQYPKKVCLSLWGDKIPCPSVGEIITAQFDIESREYNSRWFTECKAWKIESTGAGNPAQAVQQSAAPAQSVQQQFNADVNQGGGDDLPF